MMPRIVILCLFLLFNRHGLYAQWTNEVDSLISSADEMPDDTLKVARFGTLFEKLMFTDTNRSFVYAKKEHDLASRLNYHKGIFSSLLHFGTYFENLGQMDSAKTYFLKSKDISLEMNSPKMTLFINHALAGHEKKLGNYDMAIRLHNENIALYKLPKSEQKDLNGFNKIGAEYLGIAEIYKEKGNYKLAVEQALKALRFFEEIKHVRRTGDALHELGNIEYRRKKYGEAIAYGLQAIAIYKDHDYHEYSGLTSIDVGKGYMKKKDFDNALTHFQEALKLGRSFGFVELEATALTHLGIVHNLMGKHTESLSYLTQGYDLHQKSDSKINMLVALNALSKTHLDLSNYDKVIGLTSECVAIGKELGALPNLSESYLIRSEAFAKVNNHVSSLVNFKLHKKFNDSIFDLSSAQQIEELQAIYETEKKMQRIVLQEKEIGFLEEKEKNSTLQKMLLGFGLLLSLIGYYALRQKIKRQQLEREKLNAELAFKRKELTTNALHLAKKNETLENLKQKAKKIKTNSESKPGIAQLIRTINFDLQDDSNWEHFSKYFEEVHKDFNSHVKAKYPELTSNELRLMALLKMNLSSKEIANILNISQEGIKKARYRLRKKLDIPTENSLQDLVLSL